MSQVSAKEEDFRKLSSDDLRIIAKKISEKILENLCYPLILRQKFLGFQLSFNDADELWHKLKSVFEKFKSDPESYYSTIFGILLDNLLSKHFVEHTFSNTLLQDGAITDKNKFNGEKCEKSTMTFKDAEIKSFQYLAGYIIHNLFNKLHYSEN